MQVERIGLRIASLRQPLRKALHIAAGVGVRGVEIDARSELRPADMSRTAVRQFRKLLDDLRLSICGVAFPTRRGYAAREDLDRRLEGTRAAMRLAYELGSDLVIVTIGTIPPDGSTELSTLVEAITALAAFSDRMGTRLAALTDRDNAMDLPRLVPLLREGALDLAVHPGNLVSLRESPTSLLERLGPHVAYMYASDAVREAASSVRETQLGRGSADLPALLALLEGFDYHGWITIDRRETALSADEAENAVAFLKSV